MQRLPYYNFSRGNDLEISLYAFLNGMFFQFKVTKLKLLEKIGQDIPQTPAFIFKITFWLN